MIIMSIGIYIIYFFTPYTYKLMMLGQWTSSDYVGHYNDKSRPYCRPGKHTADSDGDN